MPISGLTFATNENFCRFGGYGNFDEETTMDGKADDHWITCQEPAETGGRSRLWTPTGTTRRSWPSSLGESGGRRPPPSWMPAFEVHALDARAHDGAPRSEAPPWGAAACGPQQCAGDDA